MRFRRGCLIIAVVLGLLATALAATNPALAKARVALVIGNDSYPSLPADRQLQKAVNDAAAVGDALTSLGFKVVRGRNLNLQGMWRKLAEFTSRLQQGDLAVLFFAGHGVGINGVNYLLPSDIPALSAGAEMLIRRGSVSEPDIIAEIQARGVRVMVLILDACRDNPFGHVAGRTVGLSRGLGKAKTARGVFTIYSAGIGQAALDRLGPDDPDNNSVFTRVFVDRLPRPGVHLSDLAIEVRERVAKLARSARDEFGNEAPHEQTPAYYDQTLGGKIYLAGLPKVKVVKPSPTPPTRDLVLWEAIKDLNRAILFEDFLKKFPNSRFASEARARLMALQSPELPPVQPLDDAKTAEKRVAAVPPSPAVAPVESVPQQSAEAPPARIPDRPLSTERERTLRPKDTFKECDVCPEMIVVPAGEFTMGSPEDEAQRDGAEGPLHGVTIAKPFAVGRFAITFAEWDTCVAGGGCRNYRPPDHGWGRGRRPAVNVSWDDAKAYIAWLSTKTGKTYRLLSEAEHEYVTRAGTKTPFWFGSSISTELANYRGSFTYGKGTKGKWRKKTVAVDSFKPNSWGLYQVHGNVYEHVEDCWNGSYVGAPTDGSAWTTGDCDSRVIRGGSWVNHPRYLRSAHRSTTAHADRNIVGFRVARTIDSRPAPVASVVKPKKVPTVVVSPPRPSRDAVRLPLFLDQFAELPEKPKTTSSPLSARRERSLKPKDVFRECDHCPEMIVVPPGSFRMGAARSEYDSRSTERPRHRVRIRRKFAVGRFAVTFDEWDACVADGGCKNYSPPDEGWGRGRQPVINVSWQDAKTYIRWLSRKTGKRYRLLTEAEREYVTRAGTKTPFWWGTSISTRQANYNGNYTYGGGPVGEYRRRVVPVDMFEPNPWGLYQVHGNVWEWVEDCWNNDYTRAPKNGRAWLRGDCKRRVLRGGSWGNNARVLRSAYRIRDSVSVRLSSVSFRVARPLGK